MISEQRSYGVRPQNVTLDKKSGEFRIDWGEGHISTFPLDALREACPCVVCRGGHEKMGPDHDPNIIELIPMRTYTVEGAEMVGNYAIQFAWSDGHNHGIYTWDYLLRICPCDQCKGVD